MIYNEEFFLLHSELCKTISNPKRQAILFSLKEKELNVRELVDKTGISQSTISQHLAILKDKGIVQVRKQGSNSYYSISNPKIMKAYDLMSSSSAINIRNHFRHDLFLMAKRKLRKNGFQKSILERCDCSGFVIF